MQGLRDVQQDTKRYAGTQEAAERSSDKQGSMDRPRNQMTKPPRDHVTEQLELWIDRATKELSDLTPEPPSDQVNERPIERET